MAAEIVNLNKFRKAKERTGKEKRAEENRAKFGRTKAERIEAEDERRRRDALLDGARLASDEPGQDTGGEPA